MEQEMFYPNLSSVDSVDNPMETEDSFENGEQSKPEDAGVDLGFGFHAHSFFDAVQQIKRENTDYQEQNEADPGFSIDSLADSFYTTYTNKSHQANCSTSSINQPRSPNLSNMEQNNEDSLNTPPNPNDNENLNKCSENPVEKARRGRGRWRKGNSSNETHRDSSSTDTVNGLQRGRGRGRGIRRGYRKNSSERLTKLGFSPSMVIKEESLDPLTLAAVAEEAAGTNLSHSGDGRSNGDLKMKNTDSIKEEPLFKVRSHNTVTRRSRGTNRLRASVCKKGLLCRQHDVLAPVPMMIDNCLNSLNIPYFSSIQLMHYGDQSFEAELIRFRNRQNDEDDDNVSIGSGTNGLVDLDSLFDNISNDCAN